MVIMAGMLPGVECARRRRLRQGGAGEAAGGGGTRRSFSLCLYAAGHGGGHLAAGLGGAGNSGKQRSSGVEVIHGWTLDSNAREAKERLDQKLRSKREAVAIKSTGSIKLGSRGGAHGSAGGGEGSSAAALGVQREVYSRKGVMLRRLMRWGRPRWDAAECAVCLDEFRAGDVLAHLPSCGHRFHWACALPWLEGTARCPFCRAAVDASNSNPHAAAA